MPKWYGMVFTEIWQINKNDVCGWYSKMWKVFRKWEKLWNKIIQLYNHVKINFKNWKPNTKLRKLEREENTAKKLKSSAFSIMTI